MVLASMDSGQWTAPTSALRHSICPWYRRRRALGWPPPRRCRLRHLARPHPHCHQAQLVPHPRQRPGHCPLTHPGCHRLGQPPPHGLALGRPQETRRHPRPHSGTHAQRHGRQGLTERWPHPRCDQGIPGTLQSWVSCRQRHGRVDPGTGSPSGPCGVRSWAGWGTQAGCHHCPLPPQGQRWGLRLHSLQLQPGNCPEGWRAAQPAPEWRETQGQPWLLSPGGPGAGAQGPPAPPPPPPPPPKTRQCPEIHRRPCPR